MCASCTSCITFFSKNKYTFSRQLRVTSNFALCVHTPQNDVYSANTYIHHCSEAGTLANLPLWSRRADCGACSTKMPPLRSHKRRRVACQHFPDDQTLRLQAGAGEDDVIHLPSGLDRVDYERQEEEEDCSDFVYIRYLSRPELLKQRFAECKTPRISCLTLVLLGCYVTRASMSRVKHNSFRMLYESKLACLSMSDVVCWTHRRRERFNFLCMFVCPHRHSLKLCS